MSILSLLADGMLIVVLVLVLREGAFARLRARLRRAPQRRDAPSRVEIRLGATGAVTIEHVATRESWTVNLAALADGTREIAAASGDALVLLGPARPPVEVSTHGATSVLLVFRPDDDGPADPSPAPRWVVRAS
ncbi:MAG: hypothetical protein U0610_09170 [bacterium]